MFGPFSNKIIFMDTWMIYHFHESWNVTLVFHSIQTYQNAKTILSSWAIQKLAVDQICQHLFQSITRIWVKSVIINSDPVVLDLCDINLKYWFKLPNMMLIFLQSLKKDLPACSHYYFLFEIVFISFFLGSFFLLKVPLEKV